MEPPIVSGTIPPLAEAHILRDETGFSLAGLPPGATVVLVPAEGTAPTAPGRLGGTGKTHLAAVSADMLRRDPALQLIVWITATGRDAVLSSYAQALRDVGVRAPGANPEQAAAQFLTWLAQADRPWLVVLDDLSDRAMMDDLWPRGPAGWVLVTTEQPDTTADVSNKHVVPVGSFSRREALACLTVRQYTDASQRSGALDLAGDLGFQTVALAQAAAVMTALGIGCGKYRSRLAEHWQRTASLRAAGQHPALAAAWSASAEVADLLPPAGLAGRALALVSMLAPQGIPGAVLASDAACEYLTGRPAGSTAQRAETSAAVHNLARVGLVSIDPGSAAGTVLVHPVVQAITREQLAAAVGVRRGPGGSAARTA